MRVDYGLADEWTQTRISEVATYLERLRRDVRDYLALLPQGQPARVALQLSDLLFDVVDALDPVCLLPVDVQSAASASRLAASRASVSAQPPGDAS